MTPTSNQESDENEEAPELIDNEEREGDDELTRGDAEFARRLEEEEEEAAGEIQACETCQDDESKNCRDCGCTICGKKHSAKRNPLLFCGECGYKHMACVGLSITDLPPPSEDW